jgi:hypothetical protein
MKRKIRKNKLYGLVRWHACMLRKINLVGCSYLDIIDSCGFHYIQLKKAFGQQTWNEA